MKDEGWMMKDDDFKLLKGFALRQTDGQTDKWTDICDCRVAFATENTTIESCNIILGDIFIEIFLI